MKFFKQSEAIITTFAAISAWSDGDLSACGTGATVWLLGENYVRMRTFQARMPITWKAAPVGALVNEIALRLCDEFTNLDHHLRRTKSDPVAWHAGDIAERSPYASRFTLNACRLIAVREAMTQGGVHIIVTETPAMARPFWQAAQAMGCAHGWLKPAQRFGARDRLRVLGEGAKLAVCALRVRLGGVYALIKRIRTVRALRRTAPVPLEGLRHCDVLALLWTRKDSFSATHFTDEALSLGRLPEVIRAGGRRVGYISSPLYWLGSFAEIATNGISAYDHVLLLEDTIDVFDVFDAAWRSLFSVLVFKPKATLGGHDVTPMLKLDMWCEWASWRPAYARLFACVGRYLALNDIKPPSVLHLYENHSWEKCLRLGLRRYLPETKVVGCQQSPFSPLYLNFLPTRCELRDGEAVDRLMVSGPRFKDVMSRAGLTDEALVLIGAIRYREFLVTSSADHASGASSYKGTVLCATGSEPQDCCELVAKVAEAAAQAGQMRVIVNFHPLTDAAFRAEVMASVQASGAPIDHVEVSEAGIQTLLDEVDCVLYSDTNSAFEALSRGVPVIHVGRDSALDYNKVPEAYSINVRTVTDIRDALRNIADKPRSAEAGTRAWAGIEEALGSVDEKAILACLDIKS